jgi:hypothetical protein
MTIICEMNYTPLKAVPCIRLLLAGLSPRRPGFGPVLVRVVSVLGEAALLTGLSPSTPLCPAIIIMPLFHIHRRSQWPCGVRRGSALNVGGRGFELV